jgi:DeoR/GlpR family transcriptional regulator of sugar metabolism
VEGTLVGVIIGLLGVFIGVFFAQNERMSRDLNGVKGAIDSLRSELGERPMLPSAHLFLTTLTREAEFWERFSIQRADKILIARRIATKYVRDGDTVFVDSGTTVDQIPYMLRQQGTKTTVFTNNLLAAISVVPQAEDEVAQCSLLPGRIDARYGATYNIGNVEEPVRQISANKIVLAATAISFEEGPMVHVKDYQNLCFKRALVQRALADATNVSLVIGVDWTKFVQSHNQRGSAGRELNAVLESQEWRAARSSSGFVLITTMPPESLQTSEACEARATVETFVRNAQSGGMAVDFAHVDQTRG